MDFLGVYVAGDLSVNCTNYLFKLRGVCILWITIYLVYYATPLSFDLERKLVAWPPYTNLNISNVKKATNVK